MALLVGAALLLGGAVTYVLDTLGVSALVKVIILVGLAFSVTALLLAILRWSLGRYCRYCGALWLGDRGGVRNWVEETLSGKACRKCGAVQPSLIGSLWLFVLPSVVTGRRGGKKEVCDCCGHPATFQQVSERGGTYGDWLTGWWPVLFLADLVHGLLSAGVLAVMSRGRAKEGAYAVRISMCERCLERDEGRRVFATFATLMAVILLLNTLMWWRTLAS